MAIRLYPKILEKFMRFIFLVGFWFVYIPFGSMVKFQSLAQLPVDRLPHSVVCNLSYLLTMGLTVLAFLRFTYTCYPIAYNRFSLYYNWSLWHCFVLPLEIIKLLFWVSQFVDISRLFLCNFVRLSIEIPIELFLFPFLFLSFWFSVAVLPLSAAISLSLLFLMFSSSSCIHASTQSSILVSLIPSSFLDTACLCHLVPRHQLFCPFIHFSEFLRCLF